MNAIDRALEANQTFVLDYNPAAISPRPQQRLAVLTCMDTRLSRRALGLAAGDAHLIRNAGGIVTDDAIRSLLISHYLLGTNEFMVVNHTDCGLQQANEGELQATIMRQAGLSCPFPLHAFRDIESNARKQIQKLTTLSWIKKENISIRGFIFDVQTGLLPEVHSC
ncbi:MAG TPA: carbonic anhydrase [Verrucomicrobiae bacterium]|nr:carbonic anhydrase [Verrucomicrobiae bacterium]